MDDIQLDAAIVRVLAVGGPNTYAQNNPPQTVIIINTCYVNSTLYPFPTADELANEHWFIRKQVKIGALGPYDWENAGNYLTNPPVGFWPDYYSMF